MDGADGSAIAIYARCGALTIRTFSAAVQAFSGWSGRALAAAPALPQGPQGQRRPWAVLAFSASAFSCRQPAAEERPAEVPRQPDWDRSWSTPDWRNLRG